MNTRFRRKKQRYRNAAHHNRYSHEEMSDDGTSVRDDGDADQRVRGTKRKRRRSELVEWWLSVGRVPRLSTAEECALAHRIKLGDTDAQTQLITANLPVVFRAVRPLKKSGVPLEDLLQEGCLGLTRAARTFDPSTHSARFLTYAKYWVRCYLVRALVTNCSLIQLTGHENKLRSRYLRALAELQGEASVKKADRAAEQLGSSEIARDVGISKVKPADTRLFGEKQGPMLAIKDVLTADHPDAADVVRMEEQRSRVQEAVRRLRPFEAWLIERRYGVKVFERYPWSDDDEPRSAASQEAEGESASESDPATTRPATASHAIYRCTFEEIAEECGLSTHQVRRVHRTVLKDLRAYLKPGAVEFFSE
jgi:RNA polymerase sigma factor (sigma-70 family)